MNPAAGCTLHARLRWRRMLRFHAALIDASVLGSVRTVPTSSRQRMTAMPSYRAAHLLPNIGATALLSRHTIAYVGHGQHFGSGLFG
jgi:hypothetical protein